MVKIYGYSDDLVAIEDSKYPENEIGCYESNVRIFFDDGTEILVGYPKEGAAIWWIDVVTKGTAQQFLDPCDDEEADTYSDVFMIDAEILRHTVEEKRYVG